MATSKSFFVKTFRVFRFLFEIAPGYFFIYLFNALLQSLFPYIAVYGSALILDAIIQHQETSAIMTIVYWMIAVALLVGILIRIFGEWINAYDNRIHTIIARKMSAKTYTLGYAQIEDQKTLRLLQAADDAANGSGGLPSFMANMGLAIQGLSSLVYSIVLLRGIFVWATPIAGDQLSAFLANPWSALTIFGATILVLLAALPLMSLSNKWSYQAMNDNVEGNRRFGYFYTICNDYQSGKDIRLFSLQKMLISLQKNDKYGVNKTWEDFNHKDIIISSLISLFYSILSFVAYAFLGLKALYGYISVGSALAYAGAVTLLATGLGNIIGGLVGQSLNADYLQNYFIYLNLKPNVTFGQEKLDETQPLSVTFDHVSFTYPNQQEPALIDVSLTLHPGEKLAIVGVNGAGKTTLMKLLCRFYDPDSGTIYVNGKPLSSYDEESSYRLYAIVFQDFKLFSFPIKENVASGQSIDEDKVIACLQKAGIYERVLSFKNGINTVLYNRSDDVGIEISGGEAQKIAIARALYKNSPLVILDEPTSALDPKSEAEIYEKFGTLVAHKTAVFISHRMSSTKFCDHIAVINGGRLAEYGNHTELMRLENGLYRKMWDAQAQYYR